MYSVWFVYGMRAKNTFTRLKSYVAFRNDAVAFCRTFVFLFFFSPLFIYSLLFLFALCIQLCAFILKRKKIIQCLCIFCIHRWVAVLLLPHTNNATNILEYHNCRFSFQKPRILCKDRGKKERKKHIITLTAVCIGAVVVVVVATAVTARMGETDTDCVGSYWRKTKKQVSVFGEVFLCDVVCNVSDCAFVEARRKECISYKSILQHPIVGALC